ncbi:MAG: GNAT family N-acetyltransferase [Chloroflexi bacterium]|nr:GNAT family N-acetyltransferase [Chloroflexota bacterium]
MTTLTMRPYAGESDLPRIVDLLNACEAVDRLDQGTSIDEMREDFSDPTTDQQRDLALWEDADGMLAAFGRLQIPPVGDDLSGFMWFRIHPTLRWNHGLEGELFGWASERLRELGRQHGLTARLRVGSVADNPQRIAMLEQHGFKIVRYFMDMARPLSDPLPEPQFPVGFTLRTLAGAEEVPAWVELFNQSFIDHWDHHDLTVEQRLHWLTEGHYRPQDDLIAVAADGTLAAFCKCLIFREQNRRIGREEGWISLLGTRRGYRKLGLGRAMLLSGLRLLKAEGLDTAMLGVDADSPTGATRLYESVGFRTTRTNIAFVKEV